MREDVSKIIDEAIRAVYPENAVKRALEGFENEGGVTVLAIGKAAWRMASAARGSLQDCISRGVVITKYGYCMGDIQGFEIFEAGHPIPDENTIKATKRALDIVKDLRKEEILLFLVSGGGSSLFELPAENVELKDLINITDQLVRSGAAISEINTVRKHLSRVKGGRFAEIVKPARIFSLVLSDVIGDRLDTIASGPAYPDSTTAQDAMRVIKKYELKLPAKALNTLKKETPKSLENVETRILSSIFIACEAAKMAALKLGYNSMILTTTLDCEAREARAFLSSVAREIALRDQPLKKPCAMILGGETIVQVRGTGLGGRNQELALSAARGIVGLANVLIASVATDGTDGPTNAAGGIVDGETMIRLKGKGIDVEDVLNNNDSYPALEASGDLLKTGPTGTNVNDLIILLCG
jgi:glycerate 2-kinase (EC 2.7.1.-)